jgi:hypothetical protein
MKDRIRCTRSEGFAVVFFRSKARRYNPNAGSFTRYVRVLKALGWLEKKLGYGINQRQPPA